jgi:type IV secretory pathway VirB2 component (pilin)
MKRFVLCALVIAGVLACFPELSLAATSGGGGTGFPWDEPLRNLKENAGGVIAPLVVTLAVIIGGLSMLYGGHGVGQRTVGVIFGGSVALGFVAFMAAMGWAGATF